MYRVEEEEIYFLDNCDGRQVWENEEICGKIKFVKFWIEGVRYVKITEKSRELLGFYN